MYLCIYLALTISISHRQFYSPHLGKRDNCPRVASAAALAGGQSEGGDGERMEKNKEMRAEVKWSALSVAHLSLHLAR